MNILFIMYPWENLEPATDSTIRLVHESVSRGHNTGIIYPNNLTMRASITMGFVKMIQKPEKLSSDIVRFYKKTVFKEQMLPMSGFDVIFLRSNPPVDTVMLQFLDSVRGDTFIMNDVEGLRKANNKLYTASLFDPKNEITPATYVSKNKDYLKKIIDESESEKMILKPLAGYGGKGVIVIEKSARQSINSLLDFYIHGGNDSNYVILQEYVDGAEKGDVRVLMLNGEPIGAMKRIPAEGDIRSNVHAGGRVEKHTLTKQEKMICRKLGPKLVADGLFFVGLDIINNKLLEINVTSPGGIMRINKLTRGKLQQKVLDFAEQVAHDREAHLHRKREFRKAVEDA